jgi:hypothetical protein
MNYTGGSLGVKWTDGKLLKCLRGSDCKYVHKIAKKMTLKEVQDAIDKAKDSEIKKEIQKAVTAFKDFKK